MTAVRLQSRAEIEAEFPNQWVLVLDPRMDESLEAQAGRVGWHGQDRDEGYRVVTELRPRRFTVIIHRQHARW